MAVGREGELRSTFRTILTRKVHFFSRSHSPLPQKERRDEQHLSTLNSLEPRDLKFDMKFTN
jgi:hypothetical protein